MAIIFSSDSINYSADSKSWNIRATYYTTDEFGNATPMTDFNPVLVPVASPTKEGILQALQSFGVKVEASIDPTVTGMQAMPTPQRYTLAGVEV